MQPTIFFAPSSLSAASVSVIRHTCYPANRISRPTLLSLPASLLVLSTEAAFCDLQPVSIAVVPSIIPTVKTVAATIRAVKTITALSAWAVSGEDRDRAESGKDNRVIIHSPQETNDISCFVKCEGCLSCVLLLTFEELVCLNPVKRTKAAEELKTCSGCWWLDGFLTLTMKIHTVCFEVLNSIINLIYTNKIQGNLPESAGLALVPPLLPLPQLPHVPLPPGASNWLLKSRTGVCKKRLLVKNTLPAINTDGNQTLIEYLKNV